MKLESAVRCGECTREAVRLTSGDRAVWGTLHRPASKPAGAVVLLPGWSGPRSGPAGILVALAEHLAARVSLACLRIDLRGRGDSEGSFGETDLDMMIEDALRAGEAAREAAGSKDSYLVGLCSGGNVALGAATLDPAIARVIPLSTYPFQSSRPPEMDAVRTRRALGDYAGKVFKAETWKKLWRGEIDFGRVKKNLAGKDAREAGGRNLKDSARDIEKAMESYRGRCLFAYGGADDEGTQAGKHFAEFAARHGLDAKFHTVPGANHNFYRREWREEIARVVADFLR